MKKLILSLLCYALLLTSCGSPADSSALSEAEPTTTTIEETEPTSEISEIDELTEDPALDEPLDNIAESDDILGYSVHFADVTNGFGTDTIGQRAYIEISKNDLKDMSEEQYSTLCTYVEGLDNNWFTVICDDGTGLVFTGCSSAIVTYGQLDNSGRIDVSIGDILKSGDSFSYSESQSGSEEPDPEPEISTNTQIENTPSEPSGETSSLNTTATDNTDIALNTQIADEPLSPSESENGNGNGDNFNTHDNPEQQDTTATYVLNTNTMKIHHPSCSSVAKIAPHNYATSNQSIDELKGQGYEPCKRCF